MLIISVYMKLGQFFSLLGNFLFVVVVESKSKKYYYQHLNSNINILDDNYVIKKGKLC